MSLPPAAALVALGMAQLQEIGPALDGQFSGGTANTLGICLILLAQDAATLPARRATEEAQMRAILAEAGLPADGLHEGLIERVTALHARIDGDAGHAALNARILDLYVSMTEAAFVQPPPMG